MRIPITMCHGINHRRRPPFDGQHVEGYFRIASDLGFRSISYNDLARWRSAEAALPERCIMFDFDHPAASTYCDIAPIMQRCGFAGNIFVNTAPMTKDLPTGEWMTWDQLRDLMDAGWHVGAHTHDHPRMSDLATEDPSGALIREQFERCDALLVEHLGVIPQDFAYTGTTWSRLAEEEVRKRYHLGRLWIVGTHYDTDQGPVRFADLAGIPGADEADGGPPCAARYITRDTHPYRLPSMELERLIFDHSAFRSYLEGALQL